MTEREFVEKIRAAGFESPGWSPRSYYIKGDVGVAVVHNRATITGPDGWKPFEDILATLKIEKYSGAAVVVTFVGKVTGGTCLSVTLADGRVIQTPLSWYPRLAAATDTQRANYRLIDDGAGVHWPDVDEDLSVAGMLAGNNKGTSPAKDVPITPESIADMLADMARAEKDCVTADDDFDVRALAEQRSSVLRQAEARVRALLK